MLQQLSRHQEAIDALTQAIKINPKSGASYQTRSMSYCGIGDEQKAEANMKIAEKLSPGAFPTLIETGEDISLCSLRDL